MLTPMPSRTAAKRIAALLLALALVAGACGGGDTEAVTPPVPSATEEPTAQPTATPAPSATEEPTAQPTAIPVPVQCGTAPIHGEPHDLEAKDTDGDGIADSCLAPHDHPHQPDPTPNVVRPEPTPVVVEPDPTPNVVEESVLPASWLADPTCRNVYRWWSGLIWTHHVANAGVASEDPLRDGESFGTPTAETPEPECPPRGVHLDEYPFTAAELGCAGAEPACFINDNGLPQATRLISHQELVGSGGYHPNQLHDHAPDVDEDVMLSYLSDCLVHWPVYRESRYEMFRNGGTPIQTCSVVWRLMAYPINHLGARSDLECVWDAYEMLYLFNGRIVTTNIHTGWAEKCDSWLDPYPDREADPECRLPDGYYGRMTADTRFAEYGFSFDAPELSEIAVTERWCSLLKRCNDLWQQVAPTRHAYFTEAGWPSPCIERVSGWELPHALRGRCIHLKVLASLVRGEGEEGFPTLPPLPEGLIATC